jgi:hypothetical protein
MSAASSPSSPGLTGGPFSTRLNHGAERALSWSPAFAEDDEGGEGWPRAASCLTSGNLRYDLFPVGW